ncbi:MAG: helix-turn-helix domain-containing protein [Phycisphaerae bacterium]|nr:helix-turn-helix domain-containing protein [Phycisphaerae bacterium]
MLAEPIFLVADEESAIMEDRREQEVHRAVGAARTTAIAELGHDGQGGRAQAHERSYPAPSRCVGRGPCWTDEQIAAALAVTTRTIEHVRQRWVEEGLESALERKKRGQSPTQTILDRDKEAKLVAICCSERPPG